MPTKQKKNRPERVVEHIDHKALGTLLTNAQFPPESFSLAHQRLDSLVAAVRTMESDIGVTPDDELQYKRAQQPAEAFRKSAKALNAIAVELDLIEAPRKRHWNDPASEFYVPEVGSEQLQDAFNNSLVQIFEPSFLSPFGINISEFYNIEQYDGVRPPLREPYGRPCKSVPFDEMSFRSALGRQAIPTATAIMKQLSVALSNAAESLKSEEKRGGAAPNPIRDFVLINIVQLWYESFNGKKAIYVDEAYREFFDFTRGICKLLGVASYCSEYHLKATVSYWKKRSGRKLSRKKTKLSPRTE